MIENKSVKVLSNLKRKSKLALFLLAKSPVLLIQLPFSLLLVLLIRIIRPIYLIRFQVMNNWRIGHFAANTEMYLCKLDAGIDAPATPCLDIWIYITKPCNRQLSRMWRRHLHIDTMGLLGQAAKINNYFKGGEAHTIEDSPATARDIYNLLDKTTPHLSFLANEEDRGKEGLRKIGLPENAPFVCLLVRDDAFLNDQSPHLDWSRHNHRDCNIQNYIVAAQSLVARGYYVIRMGTVVKEAMNIDHPMIIDYAVNGMRTDFMDIYLSANCEFFISNGCGIDAIPYIFRKPIVYVDIVPLGLVSTYSTKFLSITKKHWLREKERFMSYKEIFESGAGYFDFSTMFEDEGIDLIESTPEEISDVVLEMEERLKGTWKQDREDEELQRIFWDIFPKTEFHGKIKAKFGAKFLRENKEWLL